MVQLSTFSIVAFDPSEEAWGIAVASKFPAVGAVVPWAQAGVGAIATQSYANTAFGPDGLRLMGEGRSAGEVLERLLADDDQPEKRQVGLVDAEGAPGTFTGEGCHDWAGGRTGDHFAAQGNILVGPQVIEAMTGAYEQADGQLPDRLLASLLAADRAGGDKRGRQSAAIFVVQEEAGYGGLNDRWLDYRVDDHEDPVPRLLELVEIHRLLFGKSPVEDKLTIEGEIARTLKSMMTSQGYYDGPLDETYDEATRRALQSFVGNENLEERADIGAGRIDRPAYEFLLNRFGG